jgi:putative ABC transport system permease protein
MQNIWQDARYGLRLLKREPGFALVAALTIALGIGATTTLFSVADGVLLKPLPWPNASSLMSVTETREGRTGRVRGTVSNATFLAWKDNQPATIDGLAGWLTQTQTLTGAGDPERLHVVPATPSLFTLLNARPLLGRVFDTGEGARGQEGVVLLSFGLWQAAFGGRQDVVGGRVQLDGKPYTIVGVMPREFAFPDRETRAWTAWSVAPVHGEGNTMQGVIFRSIARLRRGVTPAQASAEATASAHAGPDMGIVALALFGSKAPGDVSVTPLADALTTDVKPAILVMLVAVALLLATATANVASLQLARATTRRQELAIRAAIGAGSGRLARQLLIESAMLGLAGGAAGLALAVAMNRALPWVLPADFPRLDAVTIDGRVLLFGLVATMVTCVACSLMPVLHARRIDLAASLAERDNAPSGGSMRSRTAKARILIMGGQVAVACVLSVGAALLARSFIALLHADRGYDPVNLLTARVPMPADYPPERRMQLVDALETRLRALPGVTRVAAGNALPFVSMGGFSAFTMPSLRNPGTQVDVQAIQRVVTPDYFKTLGMRVLEGRALADSDNANAPPALVVNRSFARTYLTDRPVGQRIPKPSSGSAGLRFRSANADWEVVGVVEDLRQESVEAPRQPELFATFQQVLPTSVRGFDPILIVKTAGDPLALVPSLRDAVRREAPGVALDSVLTMEDRISNSLARPRTYALLLGVFAIFAMLISGVGLFGVLSYTVAQRTREIGVRTALGAQGRDIVSLVLGQAVATAGVGILAGLAAAAVGVKSLSTLLYGVTSYDAVAFIVVPLVLIVVTIVACAVPARRAARVDPLIALRSV